MGPAIATIAAVNLAWVVFDVTYVPLRNFGAADPLLPTLGLAIPLPWLDVTNVIPSEGIDLTGHCLYIRHFQR